MAFDYLDAPIERVGALDIPTPYSTPGPGGTPVKAANGQDRAGKMPALPSRVAFGTQRWPLSPARRLTDSGAPNTATVSPALSWRASGGCMSVPSRAWIMTTLTS